MGILDRFENGVERVVNNAIAKAFKSELKPLDLSSALRREVDDRAAVVGRDRTVVPNEFTIELATADYDQVESWGAEALADEFADNVTDYAASQRYAFVGPVTVSFSEDSELEAARFRVHSATVRGAVAPAAATSAPSARHPLVDIDGQRYILTGPVTVIGRGSEADIIVDDPGVSRRHLEIRVTPRRGGRDGHGLDQRTLRRGPPGSGRDPAGRQHADHRAHPDPVLDRRRAGPGRVTPAHE